MILYKSSEEIELIRKSCLLVSKTLAHVASMLKPGMTGEFIDAKAEEFIRDHGAIPGFKDYNGFPNTLCISANEAVVHGIPTSEEFQEDDILSIDCGVYWNSFYGDSAFTFAFPKVGDETIKLMQATNKSLYLGIEKVKPEARIGDVSNAIQSFIEQECKYSIVRELVGHGIGRNLHEAPEVPNFGRKGSGPKMKEGLVIAIEPMVNLGKKSVRQSKDGWTIVTKDGKPSAHFEHTVAVTVDGVDILSDHSLVEKELKNNEEIKTFSIKS